MTRAQVLQEIRTDSSCATKSNHSVCCQDEFSRHGRGWPGGRILVNRDMRRGRLTRLAMWR